MHRLEFCAQRMVHLNSPKIAKMLRMILFYNSDYFQSLLKHLFHPPQTKHEFGNFPTFALFRRSKKGKSLFCA